MRDTLCNCDDGLRSTGCAHAIAALCFLLELGTGKDSHPVVESRKILEAMNIDLDFQDDNDAEDSDSE